MTTLSPHRRVWWWVLAGVFVVGGCDPRAPAPAGAVGRFSGSCPLIVAWSGLESAPISYDIAADGSVTGRIAAADIVHGQLEYNDMVSTTLGADPYLLRGELAGALEPGIDRDSFVANVEVTSQGLVTSVTSNFTFPTSNRPSEWDEWKCGPADLVADPG